MRRQVLIAFCVSALGGGILGAACNVPQPGLECNFQSAYWAQYTLTSDPNAGACAKYEGDRVEFARFVVPGEDKVTFAINTKRMGLVTRATDEDGNYFRFDPNHPYQEWESAHAAFTSNMPNADGVCTAVEPIQAADQDLPEADAGSGEMVPATHIKYEWSDFRLLNTARFVSNVFEANVKVTVDECTATYKVTGLYPPRGCNDDVRCDPAADPAAGRPTGSGLSPDYTPKCVMFADPYGYEAKYFGTAAVSAWKPSTEYEVGARVTNPDSNGVSRVYQCTAAGTSAASGGPATTDASITDGTVEWKFANPGTRYITYHGVCLPTVPFDDLVKLK